MQQSDWCETQTQMRRSDRCNEQRTTKKILTQKGRRHVTICASRKTET